MKPRIGWLAADEGPLRIVVSTDQKGSRSVRQLVELEVADMRAVMTSLRTQL